MRKLLIAIAFTAVFGFANAQSQGDIRVALGLAAGTEAGVDENTLEGELGLGLNVGGEYVIFDGVSIAPSYTFFFGSEVGGIDYSLGALNIDARYYFGETGVYGLAGFTSVRAEAAADGFEVSTSESGLNLGAGVMIPISDNIFGNGQVKYQTPGDGQIVFNVGLAYGF